MVKRLFDIIFSLLAIIVLSPVFIIAVIGILISSRGSVLYEAKRAGINGKPFVMHKFRTMNLSDSNTSKITAIRDHRVFPFGAFLRMAKIDELPQLFDVLIGRMSIVGPRPEDISIVREHYTEEDMRTLLVRPGLASPGSIFNYTHAQKYLDNASPEESYLEQLLPVKLAIERVYIERQSFWYDIKIIIRTIMVIFQNLFGIRCFKDPWEFKQISKKI